MASRVSIIKCAREILTTTKGQWSSLDDVSVAMCLDDNIPDLFRKHCVDVRHYAGMNYTVRCAIKAIFESQKDYDRGKFFAQVRASVPSAAAFDKMKFDPKADEIQLKVFLNLMSIGHPDYLFEHLHSSLPWQMALAEEIKREMGRIQKVEL